MTETKRTREGNSKVRSGCITCKKRHVKCDESRPSCQRCVKANRFCGGYVSPPKKGRGPNDPLLIVKYVPKLPVAPESHPGLDWREKRALDYFLHRTAPDFGGAFSPVLWTQFMMKTSCYEKPIKHAIVAVGSIHEHYVSGDRSMSVTDYAMQQYAKAIQSVMELNVLTDERTVIDVALATCVLFASFEGMRGHFESTQSHLISGLNIIREDEKKNNLSAKCYIPREMIEHLLIRMDSQILEISDSQYQSISIQRPSDIMVPNSFSSTEEAILSLEKLMNQILHFVTRIDPAIISEFSDEELQNMFNRFTWYRESYEKWTRSFQNLLERSKGQQLYILHKGKRSPDLLILLIMSRTMKVMLEIDIFNLEMDLDRFIPVMHEIVDLSEEYIDSTTRENKRVKKSVPTPDTWRTPKQPDEFELRLDSIVWTDDDLSTNCSSPSEFLATVDDAKTADTSLSTPSFSMHVGIIPHLYLASARCRDPQLRHRALNILKNCNRREGLWDSTIAARVAERLITIEEEAALKYLQANPAAANPSETNYLSTSVKGAASVDRNGLVLTSASQIPDEVRVKVIATRFGPGSCGSVRYTTQPCVYVESFPSGANDLDESEGAGGVMFLPPTEFNEYLEW